MRNMLLDNGEKVTYEVAKNWLNSVLWKVEFRTNETGCSAEDISKKVLQDWLGFSCL